MKPFNLEEAMAGKPICTRDGRKARIIATDIKSELCPIAVAITDPIYGAEEIKVYTKDGERLIANEDDFDLFMVEEPKCPFKPFDKVLVRDFDITGTWRCDFFERYAPKESDDKHPFRCVKYTYAQCIPYNEETEHLIGTTDYAPEKYVIW